MIGGAREGGRRHRRGDRAAREGGRGEVHRLLARADGHRHRRPRRSAPVSIRIASGGAAEKAARRVIARLVDERIASAITVQDPTLWGPAAEAGATDALGWTEAVSDGRGLVHPVESLRTELARAGATRVALLAGPGTGLAASTIAATQGAALTLLDPTRTGSASPSAPRPDTVVVLADAAGSGLAAERAAPGRRAGRPVRRGRCGAAHRRRRRARLGARVRRRVGTPPGLPGCRLGRRPLLRAERGRASCRPGSPAPTSPSCSTRPSRRS